MFDNRALLTEVLDGLDRNFDDAPAVTTWRHDVVRAPASIADIKDDYGARFLWRGMLRTNETELISGTVAITQKHAAIHLKFDMDADEQAYVGDVDYSITGLVNDAHVEVCDVGGPLVELASPGGVVVLVRHLLAVHDARGLLRPRLLLHPLVFSSLIVGRCSGSDRSLHDYLVGAVNDALRHARVGCENFTIAHCKWSPQLRAVLYDAACVAIPVGELRRTSVVEHKNKDDSVTLIAPYFARIGRLHLDPAHARYLDGR